MFSDEVQKKLAYYVYFLRDPRDQTVFYVGKGVENRVFAHVANALKDQGSESDKIQHIQAIHKAGNAVEHLILRHGLTEETAFELEAAMIDFIGLKNLRNDQNGHYSNDFGLMSTDAIKAMYEADPFDEKTAEPLLLININKLFKRDMSTDQIYEATRASWKIGGNRRKVAKYAVATYRGLTREVYRISEWYQVEDSRWAFNGELADEERRLKYRHKSIAHLFPKGASFPVRYINCQNKDWTKALKQQTRDMIYNMQIALDGKLHFKHLNQQSGYITLQNLLDGKIVITNKQTGQERLFNHVDELLKDGWAID
ncbi:MAG: hypothetical protein QJT81_05845 [Candidatus Thiothrix putei]|uniref:GIY-YIG domain-containing protein n=1 Tax=Candidatus Thiothrix putei TaxID=3080811 RepID=A0AA95HIY7_9GAMM|nr:MAG: hypothetical protein QJT81_05845 [Candidatus Thiothrix putei]